jgi:hypothetical protein
MVEYGNEVFSRSVQSADYMQRLQQGWRRFGWAMFRPECSSCRMCQSLRVPVATFRPNASQRQVWRAQSRRGTVRIGAPALSRDRLTCGEGSSSPAGDERLASRGAGDPGTLLENPFRTEKWTYYLRNRLIAVAYVDPARGALRDPPLLRSNRVGSFAGDVHSLKEIIASSANH